MEISDVKRRVVETIERARRSASDRRTRTDEAEQAYAIFLETTAIPLFRQVANVLKAQSYTLNVFTPGGSVRLASEKHVQDFIEVRLETSGERPVIIGHSSITRGRRVIESERPLHQGPIESATEEDVMRFLQEELPPFVER